MTDTANLPAWVALPVALLTLAGAGLTLTGSLGLLRLQSFFQRIHAPTLGTTLGAGSVLIASMLFFTAVGPGPALEEILIAVFLVVTTPISFILLAMATHRRARPPGEIDEPTRRIKGELDT